MPLLKDWNEGWERVKDPSREGCYMWEKRWWIKCRGCGKEEQAIAIIREPKLTEIPGYGMRKDIAFNPPPNPRPDEWVLPKTWVQVKRISPNHYPFEPLQAITAGGVNAYTAFELWRDYQEKHFYEWACCEQCYLKVCKECWKEWKHFERHGVWDERRKERGGELDKNLFGMVKSRWERMKKFLYFTRK